MAAVVKIRRPSVGVEVSLHDGSDGFYISRGGWVQQVAQRDEGSGEWERPIETLGLQVDGSSHDNLASETQALEYEAWKVFDDIEDGVSSYTYLQAQLTDESNLRQAPILAANVRPGASLHGPPVSPGDYIPDYTLAVRRMPFWEPVSSSTAGYYTVDALGGSHDMGATVTVPGVVPARIYLCTLGGVSGGPLTEFWVGFRTDRIGGARNQLTPIWQCRHGDLSNNTSTISDTDAYGSVAAYCTFSGESVGEEAQRVVVAPEDLTSGTVSGQRGMFQVLLRARATGTRTYNVRLLSGYKNADNWRRRERVRVDSTSYYFYNLGTVAIPSSRYQRASSQGIETFGLRLDAEIAAAGTGNLRMDCFQLIPRDQGFAYVNGGSVQSGDSVNLTCDPYEVRTAWGWNTTAGYGISDEPEFHAPQFYLPKGQVRIIVAAQRSTVQTKTDQLKIRLMYLPRWLYLRGDDG